MDLMRRNTIADILRKNARRCPNKTAVTSYLEGKKESLTYNELNMYANRFANALSEIGIKKGDTAAIMSHNCIEFVIGAWGFVKAGVIATYVNVNLKPKEVAYQINHSDAKIIFIEDSLINVIDEIKKELKDIKTFGFINLRKSSIPKGYLDIQELYSEKYSNEEPNADILDDDVVFRMYTSGTTAFPKGIDLTYSNVEYIVHSFAGNNGGSQEVDSVSGYFVPLYHSAILFLYTCNTIGGHFVVGDLSNLNETLTIMEKEKVTWTCFPVTIFNRLAKIQEVSVKLKTLKDAWWFGGAMPLDILKRMFDLLPNLTLIPQWSQSECLVGTLTRLNKNMPLPKAGCIIGKPYLDTEIKIVDENDKEVQDGTPGEIVMRSPAIMKRYHKNEDATTSTFKNGWHHTGDVAFKDDDGFYYFVDRVKDMIKTGGVNVSAMEVEQVLNSIEGIEMSAVFGVYHPDWAEAVMAAVVPQKDKKLEEAEIIDICKKQLANFKVPKKIYFVDSIPMNHVGKLLRKNLRESFKNAFKE